MAEESMFGMSNIFDAATADNVGIRDRALNVGRRYAYAKPRWYGRYENCTTRKN